MFNECSVSWVICLRGRKIIVWMFQRPPTSNKKRKWLNQSENIRERSATCKLLEDHVKHWLIRKHKYIWIFYNIPIFRWQI